MSGIVEWLKKECPRDSLVRDARLQEAADEIERLRKIEAAAENLTSVKGRYHSEQAYQALAEVLK